MSENISGKFTARATTYNFGTAKTGTVGCAIMFEVTSGPHAGARVPW